MQKLSLDPFHALKAGLAATGSASASPAVVASSCDARWGPPARQTSFQACFLAKLSRSDAAKAKL